MKLTDALARSSGVVTEESERKVPTVHDVESGNISRLRTPKGIYLFAYKRMNYTSGEYILSIMRMSYCGRKTEQFGYLMAIGMETVGKWVEENKNRILHNDFKDKKYVLGRVLIMI